jgi:hypothetical protein
MRAAPAVLVDLGISPAWRFFQAFLWAAAAGALCAWLLSRAGQAAAPGGLAMVPAGLWAWQMGRGSRATLAWDGGSWLLDGATVRVTVALDLDRWMLLHLHLAEQPARTRWLPATATQAGTGWHGLRAALYSRAPEATLAATPPKRGAEPD